MIESDDYGAVLLLPNGSLFAVANPRSIDGLSQIHLSKDIGKTWQALPATGYSMILDVSPDPDHPSRVCLSVFGAIRCYVLQADDVQSLTQQS